MISSSCEDEDILLLFRVSITSSSASCTASVVVRVMLASSCSIYHVRCHLRSGISGKIIIEMLQQRLTAIETTTRQRRIPQLLLLLAGKGNENSFPTRLCLTQRQILRFRCCSGDVMHIPPREQDMRGEE